MLPPNAQHALLDCADIVLRRKEMGSWCCTGGHVRLADALRALYDAWWKHVVVGTLVPEFALRRRSVRRMQCQVFVSDALRRAEADSRGKRSPYETIDRAVELRVRAMVCFLHKEQLLPRGLDVSARRESRLYCELTTDWRAAMRAWLRAHAPATLEDCARDAALGIFVPGWLLQSERVRAAAKLLCVYSFVDWTQLLEDAMPAAVGDAAVRHSELAALRAMRRTVHAISTATERARSAHTSRFVNDAVSGAGMTDEHLAVVAMVPPVDEAVGAMRWLLNSSDFVHRARLAVAAAAATPA